ncbi:MAG: polysaccharide deacetylase family protein [Alphaproteobacteria bacterium]
MISKVYLTIDDSPSIHMDKKVSFLREHNIPAIFYARGECIEKYPHQIANAIQYGFLIGNHSYTHPCFSQISLTQCLEEIIKTETLINQCYRSAGKKRPCKIIRLPFADRGAGPKAKEAANETEKTKVLELQSFLKKNDFKALNFQPINSYIDSHWNWDTEDYKTKHISNKDLYLSKMHHFFNDYKKESAVILLHDFDNNHHLFEASMAFLLNKKVQFLDYHQ